MSYEPPILGVDRGYQAVYTVRPPYRGIAITGFVLALVGMLLVLVPYLGALLALVGVICGHVAMHQFARDPRPRSGKGLAIASLAVGYLAVVGGVLWVAAIYAVVSGAATR